jgi:hypothetical protein
MDDPTFVRPAPRNSWGGPSQALTALRAPRWFEFYGKPVELAFLMDRWCEAIQRDPSFRQQIDPMTGDFNQGDLPDYSPAALTMVDFTWRLAGPREDGDSLEWNIRPQHAAAQGAHFSLPFDQGRTAAITYSGNSATLHLDGRVLGSIGSSSARLITSKRGYPKQVIGISETKQNITLALPPRPQRLTVRPNETLQLGYAD